MCLLFGFVVDVVDVYVKIDPRIVILVTLGGFLRGLSGYVRVLSSLIYNAECFKSDANLPAC